MRVRHVAAALVLSGCSATPRAEQFEPPHAFFSFEQGLEGWAPRGFDLTLGTGEISWSIAPDGTRATNGTQSLNVTLNNLNDAGKVFVERQFKVAPGPHSVSIGFDFGTEDYGDVNSFTIIAGTLPTSPLSTADLAPVFRDNSLNGSRTPGYVWLRKSYRDTVTADDSGTLFVVVGTWGRYERAGTYFIDALAIDVE